MSPDKQMKDGGQRQKIMIAVAVVVFLVIGYNVMGLFSGGGGVTAPAASPAAASGNKMGAATNQAPGGNMAPGAAAAPSAPAPQPEFKQAHLTPNPDISRIQAQTQVEYLNDINNLQILKIQREIAETKQAIASAKLATITTETSIADSLVNVTKEQVAPAPAPVTLSTTAPAAPPVIVAPPPPSVSVGPSLGKYTAVSVSFQGRKWMAVLKSDTKLLNVSVGDRLDDGSTVQSIDKNGVTLKRDTTTIRLTLTSTLN